MKNYKFEFWRDEEDLLAGLPYRIRIKDMIFAISEDAALALYVDFKKVIESGD